MRRVRAGDVKVGHVLVRRGDRGGGGGVEDLLRTGGVEVEAKVLRVWRHWVKGEMQVVVRVELVDAWGRDMGRRTLRPGVNEWVEVR